MQRALYPYDLIVERCRPAPDIQAGRQGIMRGNSRRGRGPALAARKLGRDYDQGTKSQARHAMSRSAARPLGSIRTYTLEVQAAVCATKGDFAARCASPARRSPLPITVVQ